MIPPFSQCRSCGATVIFAKTEAGKTPPYDALATPDGNVRLESVAGEQRAVVLRGAALEAARTAGEPLYLSHFVTCPDREKWRK